MAKARTYLIAVMLFGVAVGCEAGSGDEASELSGAADTGGSDAAGESMPDGAEDPDTSSAPPDDGPPDDGPPNNGPGPAVFEEPVDDGQCPRTPDALADGWAVARPGEYGIDESLICELRAQIRSGEIEYVDSLDIVKDGVLVYSEVFRDSVGDFDFGLNDDPAVHTVQSVTKSFASTLVGVAIERGYLGGTDDRWLDYFEQYPAAENPPEAKDDWRVEDFLTMRTGLEWDEWGAPYESDDNSLGNFYRNKYDYIRSLLELPLVSEPGTQWTYCTICSVALGGLVENASGIPLGDFAQAELFDPLGIAPPIWLETPTGLPNAGGGLMLTGRQMAKLGQLYLNDGVWEGTRLLPQGWAEAASTPHVEFRGEYAELGRGYGYQWWVDDFSWQGEELEIYSAQGYGGQAIYVWEEQGVVVALTSGNFESAPAERGVSAVENYIIPAILAPQ